MKTMIHMMLLVAVLIATPQLMKAQNKQLDKALKKEYKPK